jgi:PTS system nitrogen regulatory IIA component
MKLTEILTPKAINIDLTAPTKEEVLKELVWMLDLKDEFKNIILEMVLQRENLGSTGVGNGVAIPHGRSLITDRLMLVCGVSKKGIHYQAIDRKKVSLIFLLIAPHREVSNLYLPLLGNIARLASDPTKVSTLRKAKDPKEFIEFLAAMDL